MNDVRKIFILIPVLGIIVFLILYFVATNLYPGGSQVDEDSVGFSWANNYWCNLLNPNAINGQPNPAQLVAIAGMVVLCLALSFFWFLFPIYMGLNKKLICTIQVSGITAMVAAFFLITNINHNLVTNIASVFGVIATVGTFIGLCKAKWYGLFVFGILNILLVGLNNYFYYSSELIIYLPVIQKITFAAFLIWFCCIDIAICRVEIIKNNRQ